MLGLSNKTEAATVSADFQHALTRQVLRTELIRIKALIGTAAFYRDHDPDPPRWSIPMRSSISGMAAQADATSTAILIPFILFELWVHFAISRHLTLDRDLPVYRRYLGALIETSMPTLALALHIDSMGPVEALGFVVPLTYFIFIILSTLRLDFWLSTFTGFVAAAELFCMAMFYHRAGSADPPTRSLLSFGAQRRSS